ncbi:MAG: ABC transporter permease, partial [Clostridia bacterium]|nr:ABC transporter permease [Clostridia bacterium]
MKQFCTVFRFTFMDTVRKKAFIVSTAILLVLILIACMIPRAIEWFTPDKSGAPNEIAQAGEGAFFSEGSPIYLLDESGAIENAQSYLEALGYQVNSIGENALETAENAVLNGEADAIIKITSSDEVPTAEILIKDFMHAPNTTSIIDQLNNAWRAGKLSEVGADEAILEIIHTSVPVYEKALGSMDLTGYTFGIVASMLMFFAVYFYGISVANSVAMEKTSRVMETLVVSAKPSSILLGKCAAMGTAGLVQMAGIILYGVIAYNLLVPDGTMIFGMQLSFSGVTPVNLIVIILYFLLGYALYALLYAVCGATVSRIEDISPALMPVSMISMISFYIGYFTSIMGNSSGAIEWVARYVPFCAPFGMPVRLLNGSVTVGQCAIS